MENFYLKVIYSHGHDRKHLTHEFSRPDAFKDCQLDISQNGSQSNYVIRFPEGVMLHNIIIKIKYAFTSESRIFCNGYQSWSVSREYTIDEKTPDLTFLGKIINKRYALDRYNGQDRIKSRNKKGTFLSYTYTYIKETEDNGQIKLFGSLSERSGFTVYDIDSINNEIIIQKDCEGLESINKYMFSLYEDEGMYEEVFDRYFEACRQKKTESLLRTSFLKDKNKKYSGFTTWYNFYQDISQRKIYKNLYYYGEKNPAADIFQIDDGYQRFVGDWLDVDTEKFPVGMKKIASKIKSKNIIPGIWLAPFSAEKKSVLYKEHPDWIVKDNKNRPYKAGSNWSGFYALDIDNRNVKNYLKNVFDTVINDWGFTFLKLDFLYSACILPRNNKTRGQLMCEAMDFLNEISQGAILLGCGVPLGPAFWNVDFCRIGADISLEWDNKPYMRLAVRERVSTRNSVVNTVFRKHLDKRVFLNDPDVFMLRTDNCSMDYIEKSILGNINSAYGSLLFTSDEVEEYDENQDMQFMEIIQGMGRAEKEYIKDHVLVLEFKDRKITIPLKDNKKPGITYL
ncbi:MAG TPA: alpha-galactosidase [Clostridia bacterium]|nr:alpha-galactosidase [Clostridia bacterium]